MAPFPESEDMTIKRLAVALRKNDYQLLKMGTYKLHEKFHTGHEFEMTDDLRQILATVEKKQYPPEISDILCSTIRDILSKNAIQKISKENQILPNGSGLTQIPQTLQEPAAGDIKELAQIINSSEDIQIQNTQASTETVQTPIAPKIEEVKLNNYKPENVHRPVPQPAIQQETVQQMQTAQHTASAPVVQNRQIAEQQPIQVPQPPMQAGTQAVVQPAVPAENNIIKNIAMFYDDFKNDVNYDDVKDYKNNLNLLFSKNQNGQEYNLLKQISTLTHLLDTDVLDIDKIISMLTTSKGKVSFITASQSQNISKIFCEKNIDFDIPFVKKPNDKATSFDLIPMVGSTNIFVCSNCNARTLKTDFNTRTLSVQCPHCDSAAFPDIYAVNSYNPDCNPVFWHRAFAALVKSQIWILVNPPLDENKEIVTDFIKTAYEANMPSRIYILSKENDKKEFYRQMFMSINDKCTIKHSFIDQDKLCEEFINEEIIKKVFA